MNGSNNNSNIFNSIKEWTNNNPGVAAGIVVGLVLAILLFTLGIFKTILALLLILFGYWLGRSKDDNVSVVDQVTKIFKKDDD